MSNSRKITDFEASIRNAKANRTQQEIAGFTPQYLTTDLVVKVSTKLTEMCGKVNFDRIGFEVEADDCPGAKT